MVESELIVSDAHWPDCDPKAWNLVTQITAAFHWDLVYTNGDWLDFKAISRFQVAPTDRLTITKDIATGHKALADLRKAAPNAKLAYRVGNHEARLQSYLYSRAPELEALEGLSLPALLHLKELDCQLIPLGAESKVGELYHLHGSEVKSGGVYPARTAMSSAHANIIFGHVHRFTVFYENGLGNHNHVAWSIGCLQNLKVDYAYHNQWTQGCAVIQYTKSGLFQITPVPFFQDKKHLNAMVFGRLFTA